MRVCYFRIHYADSSFLTTTLNEMVYCNCGPKYSHLLRSVSSPHERQLAAKMKASVFFFDIQVKYQPPLCSSFLVCPDRSLHWNVFMSLFLVFLTKFSIFNCVKADLLFTNSWQNQRGLFQRTYGIAILDCMVYGQQIFSNGGTYTYNDKTSSFSPSPLYAITISSPVFFLSLSSLTLFETQQVWD